MRKDICLGYDPVFLDILVSPKDKNGNILSELPQLGEHVPTTAIELVAGGNAMNVAKMLVKLGQGHRVTFIANMNEAFKGVIKKEVKPINLYATRDLEPNYTMALHLKGGEWQMNSIKHGFSEKDLTPTALVYLALTHIVPFSNFGLNPIAPKLYGRMVRFLNDYNNLVESKNIFENLKTSLEDLIKKYTIDYASYDLEDDETYQASLHRLIQVIKEHKTVEKIYYLDPSTLAGFIEWKWLQKFVKNEMTPLKGYKIISVNEHEFELMIKHDIPLYEVAQAKNVYVIQHDTQQIRIWSEFTTQDEPITIPVEPLDQNDIVTTVGAGDVFNAGLLSKFLEIKDIKVAAENGIKVAQSFLTGKI